MFGEKGGAAIRRWLNSCLQLLFRQTHWHAWIGERSALHISNSQPRPVGLHHITLEWRFFSVKNCWSLGWQLADDFEHTFGCHASLPWLFSIYFSVDRRPPTWMRGITGQYATALYGFRLDRSRVNVCWRHNDMDSSADLGWSRSFWWQDIHGKVSVTHEVIEEHALSYRQPGYAEYPASYHDIKLLRVRSTYSWPRFWKRSKVVMSYEIKLDDPPKFPGKGENSWDCGEDGIYGMTVGDVYSVTEAVFRYRDEVQKLRAIRC